jgi:murein L,D-transpeptidase YcbB/YkuD
MFAGVAVVRASPSVLSAVERAEIVETLRNAGELGEAPGQGLDDDGLQATLLRYAATELGQRIHPAAVERFWALQPERRDPALEFAEARRSGKLATWLKSLAPPFSGYRALQAAARRYREIIARGGWAVLAPGPSLKEGARGPQVDALRVRLSIEGYASRPAAEADRFDAPLREALAAFQSHHGLAADGSLGPQTRAALNVPAEARLLQIEANLERWRWLPRDLPADRLEIDIAGAEGRLFRAGQAELSMKVVVGDRKHRTPMFRSALEAVVLNPPWNVPTSIAQAELLPKEAREPGYLARNDFVWIEGRLQQAPGPKSALGVVKFDLPSPFGVYLHDTPSKSAFQRPMRALSHGCMRLEKPLELAALLLAPQGGTPDSIARVVESKRTVRLPLKTRTPLFVMYWTAVADPAGEIDFRSDIYGWDTKLSAALAGAKTASAVMPQLATDCTEAPKARS